MSSNNLTPDTVKDVELDLNKALQVMLNGVSVVQGKGKYTFEESFFMTQALYGLQALSAAQRSQANGNEASESSESREAETPSPHDKVMRVTWPEDFTVDDYVQVIIRHLEIGQQRGAFNFTESALIGRAIEMFRSSKKEQQPAAPQTSEVQGSTTEPSQSPSQEQQTVVL